MSKGWLTAQTFRMWGPCTEPVSADGPQMLMLRPRWIPRSGSCWRWFSLRMRATTAPNTAASWKPGAGWHLLERPLHMLIAFAARPQLGGLRVDMLDYGEGGRDLSLSLPPDLEVREGERGELWLIDQPAAAAGPVPFVIQQLEPGSLVKVAQVVLI